MEIHIDGLEVYGYHGVLPEERSLGQKFHLDLRLTMAECPGAASDRVEQTVDYTEVIDSVTEVVGCQSFNLLEKLADAVAESVLARFPVDGVWVRVTKPNPPIPCTLEGVGVSMERWRESADGGSRRGAAAAAQDVSSQPGL
jgi:dihydroneopterin aldolase